MNGEIYRVKGFSSVTVLPKLIYKLNKIPFKILPGCSVKVGTLTLKFIWKNRGTRIAKNNFKNKEQYWSIHTN